MRSAPAPHDRGSSKLPILHDPDLAVDPSAIFLARSVRPADVLRHRPPPDGDDVDGLIDTCLFDDPES